MIGAPGRGVKAELGARALFRLTLCRSIRVPLLLEPADLIAVVARLTGRAPTG